MKNLLEKLKKHNCFVQLEAQYLVLPTLIALLELLFHWEIYQSFDVYMLYAVLFSLPFSAVVLLISGTKNEKWNVAVRSVSLLLVIIYYIVQIVYHQVFGNFLSLKSIFNGAQQAMDFGYTIWEAVLAHWIVIVVGIALWIGYAVLEVYHLKKISPENIKTCFWKQAVVLVVVVLFLPVVGTCILMFQGTGMGTTYEVKMRFNRTEQSMYRLGLLQTLKKDVTENLCDVTGITEKQINAGYVWIEEQFFTMDVGGNVEGQTVEKDAYKQLAKETDDANKQPGKEDTLSRETARQVQYHTWDIDFDTLIANADNEDLREVHTYFSQLEPTKENVYTGLFEGYNLIYITAESFSDVVIDKERTPTLYRMQQEGFQFDNFYTPSWYLSTIDGEYVNCLGQIPVEGDWSLQHSAENALPVALGNQLRGQGYICNAYHNHDSYYYDRTVTHPELGYTFKAVGAGLTFESMYPESDLELMEITAHEYMTKNQPFHTYYMTMSGHLPYTYAYNSMAVKNQETVAGENWSENAACYLAANTELEYAVAYLVEELEKVGKLDNTLFVIAPDHYPYGLKIGAYDELRGQQVEGDDFEIYRNTCLIWSACMKNMEQVSFPVKVEKYCSNLDLLPTISNLMGLSYDSRLLAGKDMLSEDMGMVLLKDHSFLTDKVRYNATTGEVLWATGEQEDNIYLERCMKQVENRFYYSAKVLELDYYSLIAVEE